MTKQANVVGLITQRYAPAIGGIERYVEMLARGLVERGLSVEVITTDPKRQLPPVEERDGVFVRRFPTVWSDEVYFLSPKLGRWLSRNASRFSLLHAHSYHTPLALQAALVSQWSAVPLVITLFYHGTGHSWLRRLLHIPYRPLGRWLLRQACQVICISEAERVLVQRHLDPGVVSAIVPPGIDIEEVLAAQPYQRASGRVLVLTVGRLEFYKQAKLLITALSYLPREYEVVVIGDGPARPRIEQLCGQLGEQNRVHMLGHIPRAELLAWYRTADVFVSMSLHESFGLVVLEAVATGLPAVASDIPAHREVAGYVPEGVVSFVSPNCSPVDLARTVEKASQCECPTNVERWPLPTWGETVDGTLACYQAALGKTFAMLTEAWS